MSIIPYFSVLKHTLFADLIIIVIPNIYQDTIKLKTVLF